MENKITIGIPKGSLQEATLALFSRAGFLFHGSERSLWLTSNDPEIKPVLIRPQEIPLYVANGSLDCGLAGLDWITENNCNNYIRILADLCYSKRSFRPVRWVLAVADDSKWQTLEDLRSSKDSTLRISTELKKVVDNWLAEHGIIAEVSFSWGATEAKVPIFADAIVECTETGASLRENRLRIIATVFESTTQFFANNEIYKKDEWKRSKLDGIGLLLKSCLASDIKVNMHVQVPSKKIEIIKKLIPNDASISMWKNDKGDVLIDVILERGKARELIPIFAKNGAIRISISPIEMLYE